MSQRAFPSRMQCSQCIEEGEQSRVWHCSGMWSGEPRGGYYDTDGKYVPQTWISTDTAWFKCSRGHDIHLRSVDGGKWEADPKWAHISEERRAS